MTFDLGVKVTQNIAQYFLHHFTYAALKFEVATSNGLGGDTFQENTFIGVKVTGKVAQYPLHHVANAAVKFEDATSNT